MENQNIVTNQDTALLDAEIEEMVMDLSNQHGFNEYNEEDLEAIVAKAMKLGELYERKKWQEAQVATQWNSVDERMPEFGQPVLVYCDSSHKHDGLKITVAAYQTAKEIFDTSDFFDSEEEAKDSWIAEVGLFDDEYGGRYMSYPVTHWMPLPKSMEQSHD